MWFVLESPQVVEMAGAHGIDVAFIDLEHTATGLETMQTMIVAAQVSSMTALVRPASCTDVHQVRRILDCGADGVVFPLISSAEEARIAAASVRYPPDGIRGWAGNHARHVRWTGPDAIEAAPEFELLSPAYVAAANDQIATIFMIESAAGVSDIDEILDVGAPDAVLFGWQDFSLDTGFDGAAKSAAAKRVYEAARNRGIGFCVSAPPAEDQAYYPGCFVSAGVDASLASRAIGATVRQVRLSFGS
jgi:2-keto-3-deoxy-L-rhamnonate aldolase RhmA